MRTPNLHRQLGASLLEVLVAILILSFGMLALSGMLAFSVQMPKMAAYRATATALAASHIERMRANPQGFRNGSYAETMSYNDGSKLDPPQDVTSLCTYAATKYCTPDTMADRDKHETKYLLQKQLTPTAGMRVRCSGAAPVCTDLDGDLWIMWQEPSTFASLDTTTSDECPASGVAPTFTPFTSPKPRCLHVRFKL
jgi:type IV pilus assembly protein PilV